MSAPVYTSCMDLTDLSFDRFWLCGFVSRLSLTRVCGPCMICVLSLCTLCKNQTWLRGECLMPKPPFSSCTTYLQLVLSQVVQLHACLSNSVSSPGMMWTGVRLKWAAVTAAGLCPGPALLQAPASSHQGELDSVLIVKLQWVWWMSNGCSP